jgi:hypothetical protein
MGLSVKKAFRIIEMDPETFHAGVTSHRGCDDEVVSHIEAQGIFVCFGDKLQPGVYAPTHCGEQMSA